MLILAAAIAAATTPPAPILHYVRSNRDGSEPENIVMFRPTVSTVAVYKYHSRCTTAAYVTAAFDTASGEVASLDAGKVGQQGEQLKFGRIGFDSRSRTLSAWVDTPGGRMTEQIKVPDRPWHLFDYDFGTLNAELQSVRPRREFSFGLPLIWPQPKGFLRYMGRVDARFLGYDQVGKNQAVRFALELDGPQPAAGSLLLDAAGGHILSATLSIPNHDNYRDFKLELLKVQKGGQKAWDKLLRRHYAKCPKPR
ncbi:MAG TPA: hypothetical protein VNA29_09890 [Sphingomicrobium sp.]|nr:hypothetical protein [Sphingomicrobium sp.]